MIVCAFCGRAIDTVDGGIGPLVKHCKDKHFWRDGNIVFLKMRKGGF